MRSRPIDRQAGKGSIRRLNPTSKQNTMLRALGLSWLVLSPHLARGADGQNKARLVPYRQLKRSAPRAARKTALI
jgi:hypothetical protein